MCLIWWLSVACWRLFCFTLATLIFLYRIIVLCLAILASPNSRSQSFFIILRLSLALLSIRLFVARFETEATVALLLFFSVMRTTFTLPVCQNYASHSFLEFRLLFDGLISVRFLRRFDFDNFKDVVELLTVIVADLAITFGTHVAHLVESVAHPASPVGFKLLR